MPTEYSKSSSSYRSHEGGLLRVPFVLVRTRSKRLTASNVGGTIQALRCCIVSSVVCKIWKVGGRNVVADFVVATLRQGQQVAPRLEILEARN